ncbi:MAG TPA: VIT1/CCC1 transporter family protein, partial [Hyphomicrobiaceae bacterium]|nr:VIT1/CCC1 transporter family protein [Hyphomicrobiaceae bacterium]
TSNRERWVDTMMAEEHGMPANRRSAWRAAMATFLAFIMCGAVPLLPFVLGAPATVLTSTVMTGLTFFVIGSIRSQWSPQPFWRAGLETMAIGLAAAGVAYGVGRLLSSIA